jgi:hypothetical protein
LLNNLNAKSGLDCVAERIYCKRQETLVVSELRRRLAALGLWGFGMPLIPSGLLLVFLGGFSVGGFARLDRKR